jgi:hypothetical protein
MALTTQNFLERHWEKRDWHLGGEWYQENAHNADGGRMRIYTSRWKSRPFTWQPGTSETTFETMILSGNDDTIEGINGHLSIGLSRRI